MTNVPGSLTRRPQDLIESFLEYTSGIASPEIFRLWAGIGMVAALLERRVYVETAGERLYPNLYVLLVAPPGVGKTQAIKATKAFWKKVPGLFVSPDNMTKASLIDSLQKASRKLVKSPTELIEFNSLQIAADELGVLMAEHNLDFLSHLNKIYDCPAEFEEDKRMFKEPIFIPEPQLNILAGTQPGFMASIFPDEAWGMGFTSRLIMVYSAQKLKVSLFDTKAKSVPDFTALVDDMKTVMDLYGRISWTKDAQSLIMDWHMRGHAESEPQHTKLEHYVVRRILHLLKLCMVASISRSNEMLIREEDFHRALTWLLMAEATMPDVFRNMTQKSDAMVIQELHFFLWTLYSKEKKPVHMSRLVHFLQAKVPSERIMRILEIAERANIVIRMAGTETFRPANKGTEGLE